MTKLGIETLEEKKLLTISTVAAFPEGSNQAPGAIAIGQDGSVYTSLVSTGEFIKVDPATGEMVFIGAIEGFSDSGLFKIPSLSVNSADEVFAAFCAECGDSIDERYGGIWKLVQGDESSFAERIPGTEAIQGASGTTFDENDNLYVGDIRGSIYRVSSDGQVELWASDQQMALNSESSTGIISIDYADGKIFGLASGSLVFSIEVQADGSAGEATSIGTINRELIGDLGCGILCGGFNSIAIGKFGGVYVHSEILPSAIFRFDPNNLEGTFETMIGGTVGVIDTGQDSYAPRSVAFGVQPGDESTLYWSNVFVQSPDGTTSVSIVNSEIDPLLPGDIDRDGQVGFGDFLILSSNYGSNTREHVKGDLDGDGVVTFSDFLILSQHFGLEA